ncbi:MAG: antibiotic biosynthesis monooxygenase [Chthoniobacterales bacterium]|nr:antibiotic biosynthesis monooxygenase [Chthoniobacterales bacterium]
MNISHDGEQHAGPGAAATHPCTVIAAQRVRAERTADFLRVQEKISEVMRQFAGFLGKELIRPVPGLQDEWVSVFRFSSTDALRRWMESDERRAMLAELDACAQGPGSLQVVAGDDEEAPPVTVVFSHRVKDGCREKFRAWRDEILRAMRGWSGFLGVDVFDPRAGVQEESVMIVRFGSAASFEAWMGSPRRARLIEQLEPLVEGYTARPLGSGLGGWFAFDDAPALPSEPPRWKQILMVALGLYPTVMLVALCTDPWLRRWVPFPVQMIIGNLLCVSLLAWPVMPWLNKRFARWLHPSRADNHRADFSGALVIVVLLLLWLALFLAVGARAGG